MSGAATVLVHLLRLHFYLKNFCFVSLVDVGPLRRLGPGELHHFYHLCGHNWLHCNKYFILSYFMFPRRLALGLCLHVYESITKQINRPIRGYIYTVPQISLLCIFANLEFLFFLAIFCDANAVVYAIEDDLER